MTMPRKRISLSLSVFQKIALAFGCILMILVVLAVSGGIGLDRFVAKLMASQAIAADVRLANVIDQQMAGLQHRVRAYLASGRLEALPEIETLYEAVRKNIGVARASSTGTRGDRFLEMEKASEAYHTGFVKLTDVMKKRDEVIAKQLNQIAETMRGKLYQINQFTYSEDDFESAYYAGVVQEKLLSVRAWMTRFIDTSDPALVTVARAGVKTVHNAATDLALRLKDPDLKEAATDLVKSLPLYEAGFVEVVALTKERDALNAEVLERGGAEITRLSEAVQTSAADEAKVLTEEVDASMSGLQQTGLILVVGGLTLGVALAWGIGRGIARPIKSMTELMRRLAEGDHDLTISGAERGDEIGTMAKAVEVFRQSMIESGRLRAEQEESKRQSEADSRAAMLRIADGFEGSVKKVVETLSSSAAQMEGSARTMSAGAEAATRQSTEVAHVFGESSARVQAVAAGAEELAASISEISRQVSHSTQIAGEGVEKVTRIDKIAQSLAKAAERISVVVSLVSDIASRTNLLALNATIEAARAGEAGKGFAVVASEVKSLATQTGKATDEISTQVNAIQSATAEVVEAIKGVAVTITQIDQIAVMIAAAVEEQGAATQEITRNVQQVAAGTTAIATNISGLTDAAAQSGDNAEQVLAAAGELSRQSNALGGEVERFLTSVRAA